MFQKFDSHKVLYCKEIIRYFFRHYKSIAMKSLNETHDASHSNDSDSSKKQRSSDATAMLATHKSKQRSEGAG